MVNRVLIRKLVRDIARRKTALIALALVVSVGIISYISMGGAYRDLDNSRAAYYRDYRLTDFTVDLKRAPVSSIDYAATVPNVRPASAPNGTRPASASTTSAPTPSFP